MRATCGLKQRSNNFVRQRGTVVRTGPPAVGLVNPQHALALVNTLGAAHATKEQSPKRITLMTIGSRGDVQPLVALGKVRCLVWRPSACKRARTDPGRPRGGGVPPCLSVARNSSAVAPVA